MVCLIGNILVPIISMLGNQIADTSEWVVALLLLRLSLLRRFFLLFVIIDINSSWLDHPRWIAVLTELDQQLPCILAHSCKELWFRWQLSFVEDSCSSKQEVPHALLNET